MKFGPLQTEIPRYRPGYVEIANDFVQQKYIRAVSELWSSREGSEFLRRKLTAAEVGQKLERFGRYKANWDSYGAPSPGRNAIIDGKSLSSGLINSGCFPAAVVPSAEGGVAICFVRDDRRIEIECLNSGDIQAVRYSRNDDPMAWDVDKSPAGITSLVRTISEYFS